MRRAMWLLTLATAVLLAGCYRNNLPIDTRFAAVTDRPPSLDIFVDGDGSYFPDDWRNCVNAGKRWKAGSLLAMTAAPADTKGCAGPAFKTRLDDAKTELLRRIADHVRGANRVFILIHGFNNSPMEADEGYTILERAIAFKPGDVLIRFYWDGYVAGGGVNRLSPLAFWFKAVKNSQLAGIYGLRPILREMSAGQQAIVITHSRGASVLLSALSNPPFASKFANGWPGPRLNPPALDPDKESLPAIDAIMLGPAIGHLDFCEQGKLGDSTDKICTNQLEALRKLPALRSLYFTTNAGDLVLRKVRPIWSTKFYPTTLGYDGGDLAQLRTRYPGLLHERPVSIGHNHGFPCYASDPVLSTMLIDAKIGARAFDVPLVTQRRECVKYADR